MGLSGWEVVRRMGSCAWGSGRSVSWRFPEEPAWARTREAVEGWPGPVAPLVKAKIAKSCMKEPSSPGSSEEEGRW